MNNQFVVFTDGGYEAHLATGASAFIVLSRDGEIVKKWSKAYENTTNNRCELNAIIEAVWFLPPQSDIHIMTDSQYCILVMSGKAYKVKKNTDLIEKWQNLLARKQSKVTFHWIKGHSGNKYNEIVDEMCQEAIEEGAERTKEDDFWLKFI